MQIEPGAQAKVVHVVTQTDLATELGTGDVPVLASSRAFAWCEEATLAVVAACCDENETTVAMRVNLDHIRAVGEGVETTAIATLERVEGRRYVFVISLLDADGEMIASGRVVRVLVDTADFLGRSLGSR